MSAGILMPSTIGGTISAFDSDSISGMPINGLPIGTRVWNIDVGSFFTLDVSTASLVTDEVLAVFGTTGLRWIVDAASTVSVSAPITGDGSSGSPIAITAATGSVPGSMSAGDKSIVDAVTAGTWAAARWKEMIAAVPEITKSVYLPMGLYAPSTTAPTADGAIEGGGVSPGASTSIFYLARSLTQKIKTGKGVIVFRGKLSTTSGGAVGAVGLINAGSTHFAEIEKVDPGTNTHYQLAVSGLAAAPGSVVADTGWHNFMLAWNATNIRFFVDNVLSVTSGFGSLADEPMFPYIVNTETTTARVEGIFYGYIPS